MADPIRIAITMQDVNNKKQTVPVLMPSTATLTEINATAIAAVEAVDELSGCKAVGADVKLPLDISAATVKVSPDADAVITEGHLLVFGATGTTQTHSVRIPYPKRTVVNGSELDEEDGLVTTLAAVYTAGVGANPDPTDDAGRDLTSFLGSKHSPRTK